MIIDAHSHGLNGNRLDKIAKINDWAKKKVESERAIAKDVPQLLDPAVRVQQLEKYHFDYQLVTPRQTMDVNFNPDPATRMAFTAAVNDNMASLMEDSRGKLQAVGTIALSVFEKGGRQEVERAVKKLGLKGLSVTSHILGKPLDAPEFADFWAQVAELDVPIWIHPRDAYTYNDRPYEHEYDLAHTFGWPFETVLALSRLVFSGIMEKYPNLKVVNHHLGGGMVPFFFGRILETYEPSKQQRLLGKVMPKPLFDYFSRFYYDSAVGGSVLAVRCCYEVFGAKQIVFATDGPWGPDHGLKRMATYPDVIKALKLSAAENEQIMAGNAKKLLKI